MTLRLEERVPLARLTTIGTGGPARWLARPENTDELHDALEFAAVRGLPVVAIGLGSNVLIADEGVDAVVVKLVGELATVDVDGDIVAAGGGAANAVALHRARAAGLGGFEFSCAIPGTVGGGVRMNAGAYGGDFASVVARALVVDAERAQWRTPDELGLSYRRSVIRPGEVVARVELRLRPDDADAVKARIRELNAVRKAAQPTNRRTFGSVFKNPPHELSAGRMLEACGLKGFRVGGAQISPKHANFIENADAARSTDALALMQEARRRAREQYGVALEREVELLGPIEFPSG